MFTEERHEKILTYLRDHERASLPELASWLNISESTLRRDLLSLEGQGRCHRVRGGVMALSNPAVAQESYDRRRVSCIVEKKRIGAKAAALVQPGDLIYLDAGTTTETMIDHLSQPGVHVVTNSVNHAMKLAARKIPVTLCGGEFKQRGNALVGEEALSFLDKYLFSKGFFGTNAIGPEGELLTPDVREAALKTHALKRCIEKYVLADSSKFGQTAAIRFGKLNAAALICEDPSAIPEDIQGLHLVGDPSSLYTKEEL